MSQLSSGIVCSGSNIGTNSLVPLLSLPPPSPFSSSSSASLSFSRFIKGKTLVLDYWAVNKNCYKRRRGQHVIQASSEFASQSIWDDWKPPKASSTPSFSEILWPSAGAFVAMAMLGKLDQLLAPKGLSITTAPLGAVSALLFATPNAPSARKYSIFMSQIGCAVIGVLALTIFGPGLLAKSASVAACVAYMIYTGTVHPPAVAMPLIFIDGVKLHHLNFWYALYPGAACCILLCLIKEVVLYLKQNFKF